VITQIGIFVQSGKKLATGNLASSSVSKDRLFLRA
jgi:hypothetical protein